MIQGFPTHLAFTTDYELKMIFGLISPTTNDYESKMIVG
jgi:hypothetical protein